MKCRHCNCPLPWNEGDGIKKFCDNICRTMFEESVDEIILASHIRLSKVDLLPVRINPFMDC